MTGHKVPILWELHGILWDTHGCNHPTGWRKSRENDMTKNGKNDK